MIPLILLETSRCCSITRASSHDLILRPFGLRRA